MAHFVDQGDLRTPQDNTALLGRPKARFGALRNHPPLFLRQRRVDVQFEPLGVRAIAANEINPFHQVGDECNIAAQPIEPTNHQAGTMFLASGYRFGQLGSIGALTALDLDEFAQQFPAAAVEIIQDGLALRIDPVAILALPIGRNPQVGDKFSS